MHSGDVEEAFNDDDGIIGGAKVTQLLNFPVLAPDVDQLRFAEVKDRPPLRDLIDNVERQRHDQQQLAEGSKGMGFGSHRDGHLGYRGLSFTRSRRDSAGRDRFR